MSHANLAVTVPRLLWLVLCSLGLLFLVNVVISIFLAQLYRLWYSDVDWDPVKSQERKETSELCITMLLWIYATWHTYLKLYSLQVVPRHHDSQPIHQTHTNKVPPNRSKAKKNLQPDDPPEFDRRHPNQRSSSQRPLSATPSQRSPVLPHQPITPSVSHLNNAADLKSHHALTKHFQCEHNVLEPLATSGRVSGPPKNDLFQQRKQAKDKALQVVIPHHRKSSTDLPLSIISSVLTHPVTPETLLPPVSRVADTPTIDASTDLPLSVLSSVLTHPLTPRILLPPISRATDTPTTDVSAVNEPLQLRESVSLSHPNDGWLAASRNSIRVDTSSADHKERTLLPPISRAADTPIIHISAIDEAIQSRNPVSVSHSNNGWLALSGSSIKADTSSPDHEEKLQQEDTAATRAGPSNPIVASDPPTSDKDNTWRERFLLEQTQIGYGPSKEEIIRRIQFFHDYGAMTQQEVNEARKPYERVCYRRVARSDEPFDIDGRPETYQLDRIKCWVNFNHHLVGRHPAWPKDYSPVCTKQELLDAELFAQDDDAFSVYTFQSVTASSLA